MLFVLYIQTTYTSTAIEPPPAPTPEEIAPAHLSQHLPPGERCTTPERRSKSAKESSLQCRKYCLASSSCTHGQRTCMGAMESAQSSVISCSEARYSRFLHFPCCGTSSPSRGGLFGPPSLHQVTARTLKFCFDVCIYVFLSSKCLARVAHGRLME
ncbi:hypothetical protein BDP27DRAFT_563987 [Rhodocollybia butyracea]|uniref:Uncharacterized protein n=1 Tax=Rhodocollybia butyracea TaxID=206335 RepID=A0A9P5P4C6_9AGAR|nr:hypothetical protein BDP27DRAFT_563987 [Rhodocollybia butyracea]